MRRKRVRPSLSVLHLKPFQYLHLLDLTRCKQTQLSLRSGTNPETWHLVFFCSFLFLLGIDGVLMVLRYREALVLMPQVIFVFHSFSPTAQSHLSIEVEVWALLLLLSSCQLNPQVCGQRSQAVATGTSRCWKPTIATSYRGSAGGAHIPESVELNLIGTTHIHI